MSYINQSSLQKCLLDHDCSLIWSNAIISRDIDSRSIKCLKYGFSFLHDSLNISFFLGLHSSVWNYKQMRNINEN